MGRIIALLISVVYVGIGWFGGGPESAFKMLGAIILPLACIFFGEAMGGYTGPSLAMRPSITNTTPGCFIVLMGWVLLLLPMVMAIFLAAGVIK